MAPWLPFMLAGEDWLAVSWVRQFRSWYRGAPLVANLLPANLLPAS